MSFQQFTIIRESRQRPNDALYTNRQAGHPRSGGQQSEIHRLYERRNGDRGALGQCIRPGEPQRRLVTNISRRVRKFLCKGDWSPIKTQAALEIWTGQDGTAGTTFEYECADGQVPWRKGKRPGIYFRRTFCR